MIGNVNAPEILVLGTGHSESIRYFNNNAMVRTPTGNLLIDCGVTIKHALDAQGMSLADIDAIYITHVHGDHCFGLERVACESKFKYGKKVELIFHRDLYEELWEGTLKGSLGMNGDGDANIEHYFNVRILDESEFTWGGIDFRLVPAVHTPNKPVYGLLMNSRIYWSSDTTAIPDIVEKLGFEIGFHDVTLTDWNPVHATIGSLLEKYSRQVRERLFLMSYEDHFRDYQDMVEGDFAGFARQGMTVPL